jgi:choice-of-anchor A domain-containing protein
VLTVGSTNQDIALGGAYFVGPGKRVSQASGSLDNYIQWSHNGTDVVAVNGSIPFSSDFDELRDCSAQLARLLDICAVSTCADEPTVTVNSAAKTVRVCMSSNKPQVLNIPESYLDGTWSFNRSGPGCQGLSQSRPLIVNVIDDGDFDVVAGTASVNWSSLGDRKNILFNFPNATHVTVLNGFWGHVLAPFAHVETLGAVAGGVIGGHWTHWAGVITSHNDLYNNPIVWP